MHPLRIACLTVLTYGCYSASEGQPETVEHGVPHEGLGHQHFHHGHHHSHKDHEAILGSKQEADEFDALSASESKLRLRKLAEKIDSNGDGFVDESELTTWITKSMQSIDQQEVEERFSSIDKSNDRRISWEEYEKDTFGDVKKLDADDKRLWLEDKEYFKAADKGGDGFLEKEEFAAFQSPEHHPHMHETLIRNTLKEKDINKDGYIDLKEFLGDYENVHPADRPHSDWYESERSRFTSTYDLDKDGKLNQQEIKLWLVPDLRQAAEQETEHLFTQADANKDSLLSYDEIVDQHTLFVGSEATNYGDDLLKHTEL